MRKLLVLSAFALVGCSKQFAGEYSGALITSVNCGGQSSSDSSSTTWTLEQSGGTVTITGINCSGISGSVTGDVVNLSSFACPSTRNSDGSTSSLAVTGGTLSLIDKNLSTVVNFTLATTGSTTCTGSWIGTLTSTN